VPEEKEPIGVIGVGWVGLVTAACFAELGQPRLVDRHLAAAERLDLGGHDVARPDLVSELREAGGLVTAA